MEGSTGAASTGAGGSSARLDSVAIGEETVCQIAVVAPAVGCSSHTATGPKPSSSTKANTSSFKRPRATPLRDGGSSGGGGIKISGTVGSLRFGRELGYSIPSRPDGSAAIGTLGGSPDPAIAATGW